MKLFYSVQVNFGIDNQGASAHKEKLLAQNIS